MKFVIQRVKKASVKVEEKIVGQIGQGLLLLVGIENKDEPARNASMLASEAGRDKVREMAEKILKLRIFGDQDDKMNLSVLDIKGEILVVPQFTLFADCSKGNRPYFGEAAKPEIAKPILENFLAELKKSGLKVESGAFGAKMEVDLVNDGPVTIILDSKQ